MLPQRRKWSAEIMSVYISSRTTQVTIHPFLNSHWCAVNSQGILPFLSLSTPLSLHSLYDVEWNCKSDIQKDVEENDSSPLQSEILGGRRKANKLKAS